MIGILFIYFYLLGFLKMGSRQWDDGCVCMNTLGARNVTGGIKHSFGGLGAYDESLLMEYCKKYCGSDGTHFS